MGNFYCCRRGGLIPSEDEKHLLPEKESGQSRQVTIPISSSQQLLTAGTANESDSVQNEHNQKYGSVEAGTEEASTQQATYESLKSKIKKDSRKKDKSRLANNRTNLYNNSSDQSDEDESHRQHKSDNRASEEDDVEEDLRVANPYLANKKQSQNTSHTNGTKKKLGNDTVEINGQVTFPDYV
ncbi:hypothetical protein RFI_33388, partial [Reticulomyxa filosa]